MPRPKSTEREKMIALITKTLTPPPGERKPTSKEELKKLHMKLLAKKPDGIDPNIWASAFRDVTGKGIRVYFGGAKRKALEPKTKNKRSVVLAKQVSARKR
jgi:hypothetical protein